MDEAQKGHVAVGDLESLWVALSRSPWCMSGMFESEADKQHSLARIEWSSLGVIVQWI